MNPADTGIPDDWLNPQYYHDRSEFDQTPQQAAAEFNRKLEQIKRPIWHKARVKQFTVILIADLLMMGCGIWEWVTALTSGDRAMGIGMTCVFGFVAILATAMLVLLRSDTGPQGGKQ
jgi:hypothetical protein